MRRPDRAACTRARRTHRDHLPALRGPVRSAHRDPHQASAVGDHLHAETALAAPVGYLTC